MHSFLKRLLFIIITIIVIGGVGVFYAFWRNRGGILSDSNAYIHAWLTNPTDHQAWVSEALTQCPEAPFILPTSGFIGLLYRDSAAPYTPLSRHTGIDIFGGQVSGTAPIYAVYDGYLTRPADWHSTVIIRHDDPLQAGHTIWSYYTHMASRDGSQVYIVDDFPPGTFEKFVEQGTLLGYQGEYNPGFGIATHLHFSLVKSHPDGRFMNEAILKNTLDPSPYFGILLDQTMVSSRPVTCILGKTD